MTVEITFGNWLKRRRRGLDLTQKKLAQQANCSIITIRKIESDERRPSQQLAESLADCLDIPPEEYDTFVRFARTGHTPGPLADSITPLPWFRNQPVIDNQAESVIALISPLLETDAEPTASEKPVFVARRAGRRISETDPREDFGIHNREAGDSPRPIVPQKVRL